MTDRSTCRLRVRIFPRLIAVDQRPTGRGRADRAELLVAELAASAGAAVAGGGLYPNPVHGQAGHRFAWVGAGEVGGGVPTVGGV